MAEYTQRLGHILHELATGEVTTEEYSSYPQIKDDIDKARKKLFDFEYPIFDQNYKKTLETKILQTYYMDEIGFETYGLFKHYLDMEMNNIMPYFNQLYKSELIKFDPLINKNYTTNHEGEGTEDGSHDDTSNTVFHSKTHTDDLNIINTEEKGSETVDKESVENKTGKDVVTLVHGKTVTTTQDGAEKLTDDIAEIINNSGEQRNEKTIGDSKTPQTGLSDVKSLKYLSSASYEEDVIGHRRDSIEGRQDTHTTQFIDRKTVATNSGKDGTTTEFGSKLEVNAKDSIDNTKDIDTNDDRDIDTTRDDTTDVTSNGNNHLSKKDNYEDYYLGLDGMTGSKALLEFRQTFLNIDMMVIDSLAGLFMQIY